MIKKALLVVLIALVGNTIFAQAYVEYSEIPKEYEDYIYADKKDVEWFVDAKFGVFVHWGPYSIAEVPASWGRKGPRPGARKKATSGVPLEEYNNLYKKFNPVNFNADEWIKMVKESGAKYFVFTTKHHDGFCMFDAPNTDYKITNTPYGKDIAKELADACHKYGIKLFWYYSQPDWHHPDCLTDSNEAYRDYMYEHLRKLMTDYGKVDGLFFDGLGVKYTAWDTPRMLKMIRTLQPEIIINKRWGGGIPGVKKDGDYDTPEQQIGVFQIDRPWETCSTIAQAWSWTGDKGIKTPETNLRILIQCAGSGGNLLLNTGPKPDGTLNPSEVKVYDFIGDWLKEGNSESIYSTTGGPYEPGPWGVSTRKGNKIYIHVLTKFAKGADRTITLPNIPSSITKSYLLSNNKKVDVVQNENKLVINLDKVNTKEVDIIVVLEIEGKSEDIEPIKTTVPKIELETAKASSTAPGEKFNVDNLLGGKHRTFSEGIHLKGWWASGYDDKSPWVEISFAKKEVFNYIELTEQIRNCGTRKFVIEASETLDGDNWDTIYKGNQIGMDFSLKLPTTTAYKLRIRFLKQEGGSVPSITNFHVLKL